MKKIILISLFIFINNLWAMDAVGIMLPEEMLDDSEFNCSESNLFGKYYEDGVASSALDTNILVLENDIDFSPKAFVFRKFPNATHSLIDAIKTEFRIYQECNYIRVSEDELEEMFKEMDTELVPEIQKEQTKLCIFYYTPNLKPKSQMIRCSGDGSLWCLEEYIIENVYNTYLTQSLPYRMDFAARLRAENGFLIVPADLEGQAFSIFNLNGRVLRKGELRNNMPLPHEPTILRVKGYGDMYLK